MHYYLAKNIQSQGAKGYTNKHTNQDRDIQHLFCRCRVDSVVEALSATSKTQSRALI